MNNKNKRAGENAENQQLYVLRLMYVKYSKYALFDSQKNWFFDLSLPQHFLLILFVFFSVALSADPAGLVCSRRKTNKN